MIFQRNVRVFPLSRIKLHYLHYLNTGSSKTQISSFRNFRGPNWGYEILCIDIFLLISNYSISSHSFRLYVKVSFSIWKTFLDPEVSNRKAELFHYLFHCPHYKIRKIWLVNKIEISENSFSCLFFFIPPCNHLRFRVPYRGCLDAICGFEEVYDSDYNSPIPGQIFETWKGISLRNTTNDF